MTKELKKKWSNAANRDGTLRDTMHTIAMETLTHYKETGDTSVMSHAYGVLSDKSPYRPLLSKWFRNYGGLSGRKGDASKSEPELVYTKKKDFMLKDVDLKTANKNPFYIKVGGHNEEELMDSYILLKNLLKRVDNEQKKFDKGESKYKAIKPLSSAHRKALDKLMANAA